MIRIGCAGWRLPKSCADQFAEPFGGTHLERYSRILNTAEINSTFYRPHKPETYLRWAGSVPEDFRFAVKIPKEITHRLRLCDAEAPLDRFLSEAANLGTKLGPLLVQLPPSLAFEPDTAEKFFETIRQRFDGGIVCEPRHASWFQPEAEEVLLNFHIGRVAADPPAPVPGAAVPGGWPGIVYYRLHGSPRIYYSAYGVSFLEMLAKKAAAILSSGHAFWCIFDNTASGAAVENALDLTARLLRPA